MVAVIEFDHQAQEDLYARVGTYLRQRFGDLVAASEDEPAFFVDAGGRSFLITVSANGSDTAVMAYTKLGGGVAVTPEVALFLLRTAHGEMPFGTVGLNDDNAIVLHHVLFSEAVTEQRLAELLTTLAESCDRLDDGLARLASRRPGPGSPS